MLPKSFARVRGRTTSQRPVPERGHPKTQHGGQQTGCPTSRIQLRGRTTCSAQEQGQAVPTTKGRPRQTDRSIWWMGEQGQHHTTHWASREAAPTMRWEAAHSCPLAR